MSKTKRTKRSKRARQPEPVTSDADREVGAESVSTQEPQPHRTAFKFFRENIEALAVAFVLALIIRHFALEAFEIPTGSMAPTLYGMHAWATCPNCSTEFTVGLSSDDSGRRSDHYRPTAIYRGPGAVPGCPEMPHVVASDGLARCSITGRPISASRSEVHVADAISVPARCPLCEFPFAAVLEEDNYEGGHKIFVTKFAYTISEPQRWDVVVFGFDQWKNYIKRLVGLPGERIDIWDGDIYVDGEIERKSDHPYIQDVLWTKLHDSDVVERGLARPANTRPAPRAQQHLLPHPPAWRELAPEGTGRSESPPKNAAWNETLRRWSINAKGVGELAILDYARSFESYYNYNLMRSTTDELVGDKKVALTVRSTARGTVSPGAPPRDSEDAAGADERFAPSWFGCEIRDRDFTFQLRIPFGERDPDHPAVIERIVNEEYGPHVAESDPRRPAYPDGLRVTGVAAIPYDRPVRVEFENVDDRVAARIDGEEILALGYRSLPAGSTAANPPPPPDPEVERRSHGLRLVVANAQIEIESVQVFRDTYYIDRVRTGPQAEKWPGQQLGENEYFVLGDNSPSSSDGRYWGSVPSSHFMGKALVVIWPAWPTNFQMKWIR